MSNPAPPQPRTWSVNEVEVASYLNSVRDALIFLANPPVCNATQATFQTLSTAAWGALNQDSTAADPYGMHSNTTNNSRATSQAAGYYMLSGASCISSNATGWRGARMAKNGSPIVGGAAEVGTNPSGVFAIGTPAVIAYLNVGDYAETHGFQNSGGNLNTSVNTDANCGITAVWLHA